MRRPSVSFQVRFFLAIVAGTLAVLAAADLLFPLNFRRLNDLSVAVLDRDHRPLRVFTNHEDSWRLPARPNDVSPLMLQLLFAAEDRRFRAHWGVDPLAVLRAVRQNLAARRIVSGASTLTMQVVRLLEPRPRTMVAKLIETLRALQIEAKLNKDELLAIYLTLAPYGGNVEGIRAAAQLLFDRPPAALSTAEAALLVALPQAPSRLRPDRFPDRARRARDRVLDRAVATGVLTAEAAALAKQEPIPTRRLSMPMVAPHLAGSARRLRPQTAEIVTTLDGSLQRAVESLARRATVGLGPNAGLAILVIDNRDRTVAAYLGSPDLLDEQRLGPIDMVRAVRSPGSALKPFIYGLGFDDRVIHPETLVSDVSTRFGAYAPANFDRGFSGDLTVREALQRSLNVPAVIILDRIGPNRFAAALTATGVRLVFPRGGGAPGLPLALGGVSINLWDLTSLFVGLARGGLVAPLRLLPDQPELPPVRLMTETSAGTVVQILEGTVPPPGLVQAAEVLQRAPIALKTGTSYGFRDAWSFGISGAYTVGVWVGRPDGTPSPDRFGRNTAAPILYQVFDLLPSIPMPRAAGRTSPSVPNPAPELLRRLDSEVRTDRPIRLADQDKLRLIFPTEQLVLDLVQPDGSYGALMMQAAGGRRPLTWLVNGRPVESRPSRREAVWRPDGPGFARIAVIDAEGRTAGVEVQIR